MFFSEIRKQAGLIEFAKTVMCEVTDHNQNIATAADDGRQWFVMRDLTRGNAKLPAYKMLEQEGIKCFTPMVQKVFVRNGRRERRCVPYIHDLVFAYERREVLDPIVEAVQTFQYRFLRNAYCQPMTVRNEDMERFIRAVQSTDTPRYYRADEITPAMLRHRIRIIGGRLDGYEGFLLTVRGSKVKRLLVELPTILTAAVEVEAEFVELV